MDQISCRSALAQYGNPPNPCYDQSMRLAPADPDLFGERTRGLLEGCPNPKPSPADKASFGRLASLYTAFSTEFASFALKECLSRGHTRIADPFAGMGTLGEAARVYPVDLVLNDLNPFAVASCCVRTATIAELERATQTVRSLVPESRGADDESRFRSAVNALLPRGQTVVDCLLDPSTEEAQFGLCCLHILSIARISMHKRLRGSNPTWTKRAGGGAVIDGDFESAVEAAICSLCDYAAQLPSRAEGMSVRLSNRDVADLDWAEGGVDAIVTSPPYPNRTDYIRHYLPAAELLLAGDRDIERRLREIQIGTPLIRGDHAGVELPRSVEMLIERVRTHRSYASERYYAKGFRYYFEDMSRALARFAGWLAPKGIALLVVQDTFYKEILVPVADLLGDIAQIHGLDLVGVERFKVRNSMSRLSPHTRAALPKPQLAETVILLSKV
ncbi:hypothetical protein [Sphingomonas jatrophae]|uniref:site-specific DNA-methyltransferase (cytosine-N(4)-specific) n=1 Tax=Sphingomonas jatrophae TaxID=1166337 RepID=A0A1I6JLJ9_9SPHN|nr:hypothetical protein [Sphingomonas jatrophae]SFR79858.1 hypothetical protein SAMN05192580_0478 [Sphingomonas jatrophae]